MEQPAPQPRPLSIPLLQVLTALVLMALGFLVVIQSRAGRALVAQPEVPTRYVYALATLLREEREAHVALEAEVAELRNRLEVYERAAAEGQSLTAAMSKELETLRAAVGLKAMEGPGVTVTMKDSPTRPAGSDPVVVTYQDIVAVVNELWAAGAEAVAVNNLRVTAMTGFGQVGGTVVVDLQRLQGPFVITAIGDPATLEGALNIKGGLVEALRTIGLGLSIAGHDRVQVPAASGLATLDQARLVSAVGGAAVRWPRPEPFCTFDYAAYCRLAFAGTGAEFRQASVQRIEGERVRTTAGEIDVRMVVDATGPRSALAGPVRGRRMAFGLGTEIAAPPADGLWFYFLP